MAADDEDDRTIDVESWERQNEPDDETIWGRIEGDPATDDVVSVHNPVHLKRQFTGAERKRKAVALRLAGASWSQIAEKCGWASPSSAKSAVDRAMADALQENVEELRSLQHQRYEAVLAAAWPHAVGPDPDWKAMDRVLATLDKLDRLHGLPAPKVSEQTIHHESRETVILTAGGDQQSYIQALEAASRVKEQPEEE